MKLLFVCTGNICRSPTAEGIMRDLLVKAGASEAVQVDSAGTTAWHSGEGPSDPALRIARRHGYDLSDLRARQVEAADFTSFDLIFAMDRGHEEILRRQAPEVAQGRIKLFLELSGNPALGEEVADPYYGDDSDYEVTIGLIEKGCQGILEHLKTEGRS